MLYEKRLFRSSPPSLFGSFPGALPAHLSQGRLQWKGWEQLEKDAFFLFVRESDLLQVHSYLQCEEAVVLECSLGCSAA